MDHAENTPNGAARATAVTEWDEPPAHGLMFWLLIGLAACAFVPAILGPVWQDHMKWEQKERAAAEAAEALQARRARNEAIINGLLSDPGAQERAATRELGLTRPGEQLVSVSETVAPSLPAYARPAERSPVTAEPAEAATPPAGVRRILLNPVFATSPTREVLLGMSGVLAVAAFWLYRRR
jgi:cell division protein FtsB